MDKKFRCEKCSDNKTKRPCVVIIENYTKHDFEPTRCPYPPPNRNPEWKEVK